MSEITTVKNKLSIEEAIECLEHHGVIQSIMEDAFRAGFKDSMEGFNGEYISGASKMSNDPLEDCITKYLELGVRSMKEKCFAKNFKHGVH